MWRKKEKKREKKEKRGIEDVKGGRKKETRLVKGGMERRGGKGKNNSVILWCIVKLSGTKQILVAHISRRKVFLTILSIYLGYTR